MANIPDTTKSAVFVERPLTNAPITLQARMAPKM